MFEYIKWDKLFEYIKWDVTFEYISALSSKSWIHSGEAAYLFECITFFVQCKKNIYPRLSLSFTVKLENGLRAHLANRFLLNIDVAKIWLTPPSPFWFIWRWKICKCDSRHSIKIYIFWRIRIISYYLLRLNGALFGKGIVFWGKFIALKGPSSI